MIGGLRGRPVACSTGPGHPDPDSADRLVAAVDLAQEDVEALVGPVEDRLGPGGDLDVPALLGENRAAEIRHREPRVGGAQVGGQDDPRVVVELEHRGRPPAGRLATVELAQQALRLELAEALGDRRPGEPGEGGEVGPRRPVRLPDQLEHRPRAQRLRGLRAVIRRHREQ